MFRTLMFDLDGTLLDTSAGILNGIRRTLRLLRAPVPGETELRERFIGPPLREAFVDVCGLSDERAGEAVSLFRAYYREIGLHDCRPYDGIPEALDALRRGGYTLLVATSKVESFAKIMLAEQGLAACFADIAGSGPDGARSKKGEVIRFLLNRHGIAPEEAVMIGDKSHDLIGAAECGLAGIGVTYGFGRREELEPYPHLALLDSPAALAACLLAGRPGTPAQGFPRTGEGKTALFADP